MKQQLKVFFTALLMALLLAGSLTQVSAAQYNEGTHYTPISSAIPSTAPTGQVEVLELFWYGCPHCYTLESTIRQYIAQKPDNVYFNRVPAMLGQRWSFHGKLFYVGQLLDKDGAKDVHTKIFEAMHVQGRRIENDDAMRRFFQGLGFSLDEINTVMQSPDLQGLLNYAREVTMKSGAESVPAVIIAGKYITGPAMMAGGANLISVMNHLANK